LLAGQAVNYFYLYTFAYLCLVIYKWGKKQSWWAYHVVFDCPKVYSKWIEILLRKSDVVLLLFLIMYALLGGGYVCILCK